MKNRLFDLIALVFTIVFGYLGISGIIFTYSISDKLASGLLLLAALCLIIPPKTPLLQKTRIFAFIIGLASLMYLFYTGEFFDALILPLCALAGDCL
jgi:hypothetical protein